MKILESKNSIWNIIDRKRNLNLNENRLKCLWEKINTCLKENVDSATIFFISNCLGIPALPKQVIAWYYLLPVNSYDLKYLLKKIQRDK